MKKYVFYAMRGEEMCFLHVLMNALDLAAEGHEVRIVFEGESVKLPPVFEAKQQALYVRAKEQGLIAGVCKACSVMLGVEAEVRATGLALLDDMNGHAGLKPFLAEGYVALTF